MQIPKHSLNPHAQYFYQLVCKEEDSGRVGLISGFRPVLASEVDW